MHKNLRGHCCCALLSIIFWCCTPPTHDDAQEATITLLPENIPAQEQSILLGPPPFLHTTVPFDWTASLQETNPTTALPTWLADKKFQEQANRLTYNWLQLLYPAVLATSIAQHTWQEQLAEINLKVLVGEMWSTTPSPEAAAQRADATTTSIASTFMVADFYATFAHYGTLAYRQALAALGSQFGHQGDIYTLVAAFYTPKTSALVARYKAILAPEDDALSAKIVPATSTQALEERLVVLQAALEKDVSRCTKNVPTLAQQFQLLSADEEEE